MLFNTKEKEENTSGRRRIRKGKMKRQCKGGRRQLQTEGKQEEAAKTVNVVLSSSFCRLVLFANPKFTITSHQAWETCLAYLFYC